MTEVTTTRVAPEGNPEVAANKAVFAVPMPLAATTGEKISTRHSYRDASFRVLDALDKVAVGDPGAGAGAALG